MRSISKASRAVNEFASLAIAATLLAGFRLVAWCTRPQRRPDDGQSFPVPSLRYFSEVLDVIAIVTATRKLPWTFARDLATVRCYVAVSGSRRALRLRPQAAPAPLRGPGPICGEARGSADYRWNNQLVLQYIVSERLLFRPPQI
jgi:hypothetical protein